MKMGGLGFCEMVTVVVARGQVTGSCGRQSIDRMCSRTSPKGNQHDDACQKAPRGELADSKSSSEQAPHLSHLCTPRASR